MTKTAERVGRRRDPAMREKIVEVALARFGQSGYRGTSIASVARELGVTDAAIHYHFPTKDDLLGAVLKHADTRYRAWMEDAARAGGLSAIRSVGDWGKALEQDRDWLALYVKLSAEHLDDASETHAYFAKRYSFLVKWLVGCFRDAVEHGDLRADLDPEFEASALIAQLDGLRLQVFFWPGPFTMAASLRRYVDTMLDRLAPLAVKP